MTSEIERLTLNLKHCFEQKRLAHFYIIRNFVQKSSKFTLDEMVNFFSARLLSNLTGYDLERSLKQIKLGHPDFLIIKPQEGKSKYVIDDFNEFFRFQHFSPLQLEHRFIVISNAELIGRSEVANKLLKTLEEPSNNLTIFLLSSSSNRLLETIESRAVSLNYFTRGQRTKTDNKIEFWSQFKELIESNEKLKNYSSRNYQNDLMQLVSDMRESKALENQFLQFFTDWLSLSNKSFKDKEKALLCLKKYRLSESYFSPLVERILPLYDLI